MNECIEDRDFENLDLAADAESAVLETRGRLSDHGKSNYDGKINGVRLAGYDRTNQSVTIRMDDSRVLSFWAEITLDLGQLKRWIAQQEEVGEDGEEMM